MCNCNGNVRDQTMHEHIIAMEQKGQDIRSAMGSGLFLVPDPEAGIDEVKKIVVEDLTYKECCLRGMNCVAHKWVPYAAISKDDLRALACAGGCGGVMRADSEAASRSCGGCVCFVTSWQIYGRCG